MSGCSRIAIDGHLVALDDVEDARRDARLRRAARPGAADADGSFSDGFRMNVLPQAMALREHPHRHHGREVERRDAGHDAERLADLVDVDPGRGLLGEAALEQVWGCRRRTRGSPGRGRSRRARPRGPCRARRSGAPPAPSGAPPRGCGPGTGSRCASRARWPARRGTPRRRTRPLRRPPRPRRSQPSGRSLRGQGRRRARSAPTCRPRALRRSSGAPAPGRRGLPCAALQPVSFETSILPASPVGPTPTRAREVRIPRGRQAQREATRGRRPVADGPRQPARGTAGPTPGITNPGGRAGVRWWIRRWLRGRDSNP